MTRRVLVTGAGGMVGRTVIARAPEDVVGTAATRAEADLADPAATGALFSAARPDLVIHCAARRDDLERDVVAASHNVMEACLDSGAALIHLSTDSVFGGGRAPYTESSPTCPVNDYGKAKAEVEAELAERYPEATVVRTSLVCATEPPDPRTKAVVDTLGDGLSVTLFTDELRTPVRADDLVDALWELACRPAGHRRGVWHAVGPEAVSRYTLGLLVASWAGVDPTGIRPGSVHDHPEPRPADTRLATALTLAGLETPLRPISTLFAARRRR